MLAAGRSNQAIAADLVVALDTVKKHVSHLLDKLGATNRTEAVARARELAPDPLTRCVHSASRRRFRARAADLTLSRFSAPPGMPPKATATQTSGRQCADAPHLPPVTFAPPPPRRIADWRAGMLWLRWKMLRES
jgi:hypothetical protein